MRIFAAVTLIPLTATVLLSSQAFARPQYAAREKLNCTACHVIRWGGGPRNLTGKAYGTHGQGAAAVNSDAFYGDLRFIAYYPVERASQRSNGVNVMQASVSANVPLAAGADKEKLRLLGTYNISPLAGSELREAYVRFQFGSADAASAHHLTVGRFYVPFGLLTDEHRTYTRIQTNSTINNYSTGISASTNVIKALHLDLSLLDRLHGTGGLTADDLIFAGVANLRWNSERLPILLGASANAERTLRQPDPRAVSVYAVLSADKLSGGAVHGSIHFERVDAWNWNNSAVNTGATNPGLNTFFIPDTAAAYSSDIARDHSIGYYAEARYELTPRWTLFYKFDHLEASASRYQDRFSRHGLGFEAYLNPHLILNARFEKAVVDLQEAESSDVLAAQDDVFLMLRLWL